MMYLKCNKEISKEIAVSENIKKMFNFKRSYGNYDYHSFMADIKINLINVRLNDILFNSDAEIIYIDDEEAYRMGITL